MVSSSKKKRGQQRKIAKRDRIPDIVFVSQDDGSAKIHPEHRKYILPAIQAGSNVAEALAHNHVTNFSLEDSGVISAVLDFLRRCEDESFIKVVRTNDITANLKTPSKWIGILNKAAMHEPSCMLQIAENIGPLVRCMCNDTTRLFFKSSKHWNESIVSDLFN